MTEETEIETMKPKRGRPRKDERKALEVPIQQDAEPCPVCDGRGHLEIETEDENGDTILVREECDFCQGAGIRPVGPFEPDDVTDEDITAIEKALGYTSRAWGFIDERAIVAAAANRMGRKPVPA